MGYLFTSESVSEGHPDKVADQISDAVLDKLLAYDPSSKVACETLVTTGQVDTFCSATAIALQRHCKRYAAMLQSVCSKFAA